MLPLALVRIVKIAEERVADELIIKSQAVVADSTGARFGQQVIHLCTEVTLAKALALGKLRRDTGDQRRLR
ncbi:MAG: hypothetical protein BWZ07_01155 [Alphaproteobacteria bacterium ADurb.BinA280]|nr:MAG: hypothetical protein BWZ07_01155 [Alphaproteobacteria bacterium ADurb.BinA280]